MSLKTIDRYFLLERVVQGTRHFFKVVSSERERERERERQRERETLWRRMMMISGFRNIGTWQKNDPCREDNEIKLKQNEVTMKKCL